MSENWIDENGKRVERIPFFSELYRDEGSRGLDKKYDIHTCPDRMIASSLGKTEHECFVKDLLGICKAVGYFVGFEKKELEDYDEFQGAYFGKKMMRLKKVKGIEVLFPTEDLLKNQKVEKRD